MDRTLSRGRSGVQAAVVLVVGLLPAAMVLHDVVLTNDPMSALLSMPLPVAGALLLLIGAVFQSGAFNVRASPDHTGRMLGRAGLALGLLALILVVARARHPLYGAIKLAEIGLCGMTALALAAAIRAEGEALARALLRAFVYGVAGSLPLMALARIAGLPPGVDGIYLAGFTHIRILGFSLALSLAGATALWACEDRRTRTALLAAMAVIATALFWSGGRGALAALVLPLPILALFLPTLRPGLLPLVAALVAGAALAAFLPSDTHDFSLAGRLAQAAVVDNADTLSSGRLAMWRTLLDAMSDAPLLGHGAAQTHWIFQDAGYAVAHVHAHNLVLDTALALGWPGAALAGALVAMAWGRWSLRARASGEAVQAAGVAIVTTFLALAMIDGPYFYWEGLLPLAIGIALLADPRLATSEDSA